MTPEPLSQAAIFSMTSPWPQGKEKAAEESDLPLLWSLLVQSVPIGKSPRTVAALDSHVGLEYDALYLRWLIL